MPNKPFKVENTTREVIQNKLLSALNDDSGVVAALLSERDCDDLIFALARSAAQPDFDPERRRRCLHFLDGITTLKAGAFTNKRN